MLLKIRYLEGCPLSEEVSEIKMGTGLGSLAGNAIGLVGTIVVVGIGLQSLDLIQKQSKNIIKPTKIKFNKNNL